MVESLSSRVLFRHQLERQNTHHPWGPSAWLCVRVCCCCGQTCCLRRPAGGQRRPRWAQSPPAPHRGKDVSCQTIARERLFALLIFTGKELELLKAYSLLVAVRSGCDSYCNTLAARSHCPHAPPGSPGNRISSGARNTCLLHAVAQSQICKDKQLINNRI